MSSTATKTIKIEGRSETYEVPTLMSNSDVRRQFASSLSLPWLSSAQEEICVTSGKTVVTFKQPPAASKG